MRHKWKKIEVKHHNQRKKQTYFECVNCGCVKESHYPFGWIYGTLKKTGPLTTAPDCVPISLPLNQ